VASRAPIGVGIVGCGRFGTVLAELAHRADLRVIAVYDRYRDPADLAAHTGAFVSRSLAELLSAEGLTAVLVATSHDTHRLVTQEALKAGKHVFCQKPMALDVADCHSMGITAAETGRTLLIGHVQRLWGPVPQATALLASGGLGEPVLAAVVRCQQLRRRGWWASLAASGGPIFSPGIHEVDLLNCWLGRPVSADAEPARAVQDQLDYPDSLVATIRYESGAVASLVLSLSAASPIADGVHSIRVLCTGGALHLDATGLPSLSWQAASGQRGQPAEGNTAASDDGTADAVVAELENFAAAIRGEAEPFVTPADATLAVAVCSAVNRSLTLGKPVDIDDVLAGR